MVVSEVLREMLDAAEPGMTTREPDALDAQLLEARGARSAPRLTYGFPGATCISINEEAAHGVPCDRVIRPGDLLNVDVSAEMDGYFADIGGTRVVPPGNPQKTRLCHAARTALQHAMKQARAGLASHGVGRALHEAPEHIPGYFDAADKRILKEGLVINIEPFLSTKSSTVTDASDGWTLIGGPGNLSAQYEHTLIITKGEPTVVTRH